MKVACRFFFHKLFQYIFRGILLPSLGLSTIMSSSSFSFYIRFHASMGWMGFFWWFISRPVDLRSWLQRNFFRSPLTSSVHVLHGLPFPLWSRTSINLQLLTRFSLSILSTCPNHSSLVWLKTCYTGNILPNS